MAPMSRIGQLRNFFCLFAGKCIPLEEPFGKKEPSREDLAPIFMKVLARSLLSKNAL